MMMEHGSSNSRFELMMSCYGVLLVVFAIVLLLVGIVISHVYSMWMTDNLPHSNTLIEIVSKKHLQTNAHRLLVT